jgi:hypothetical protein
MSLCAFLIFLIASPALAFQTTGALTGRVTDQFGAVVVAAQVTVEGAGGVERKVASDGEGRYAVSGLPPGAYSVRVEARGFSPFEQTEVEIIAGRKKEFDAQLAVGLERQEVTVGESEGLSAEAGRNASALTLRESELEALPEDPEDLAAALQALSGAPVGPNGGQVLIDGFLNTGEPLPNRSSIREVASTRTPSRRRTTASASARYRSSRGPARRSSEGWRTSTSTTRASTRATRSSRAASPSS